MSAGEKPRVLDVGQCGFDHGNIARLLETRFGAAVDRAHSVAEAERMVASGGYDLVLVNRILDADGDEGIELVRRLRAGVDGPPVMLVSNLADAQAAAVAAGAVPGFGKAQLADAGVVAVLEGYLGGG